MTIKTEILARIKLVHNSGTLAEQMGIIDQIEVLLQGSEALFSKKFVLLSTKSWGANVAQQQITASRLFKILEAEDLKSKLGVSSISSDQIIPTFELSSSDKQKLTKLASGIRKIVTASTDFDQAHRVRLLNRIAAMEAEIEKPKGLFDVFLGGLSDFGETAGKFGTDIKPLTDRVKEMVSIARSNTREYDKLEAPAETKKLDHPDSFEPE
jgi:hypothetical protein